MNTIELACPTCGVVTTVEQDECGPDESHLVPCSGSDECLTNGKKTMLCANCRWKCYGCDLWACDDHIEWSDFLGEWECHLCRMLRNEQALQDRLDCSCEFRGDQADASDCPVHGPTSPAADAQRSREAQQEASYWQGGMPAREGEPF